MKTKLPKTFWATCSLLGGLMLCPLGTGADEYHYPHSLEDYHDRTFNEDEWRKREERRRKAWEEMRKHEHQARTKAEDEWRKREERRRKAWEEMRKHEHQARTKAEDEWRKREERRRKAWEEMRKHQYE